MARIIREGKLQPQSNGGGITRITVGGFKSIVQEQSIEIKPLTILAGANSSGKSSMMQPLLLLKQTLEATFDPGALLLNGPNVKFTEVAQLLSRTDLDRTIDTMHIEIGAANIAVAIYFVRGKNRGFDIQKTVYRSDNQAYSLSMNMSNDEILTRIPPESQYSGSSTSLLEDFLKKVNPKEAKLFIARNRFFLIPTLASTEDFTVDWTPKEVTVGNYIHQTFHLPGLRGSPERDYPSTAVGPTFPGTFEIYAASVIEQWQLDNEKQKLTKLFNDLARLALTNKVVARRKNATAIELLVNRLLHSDKEDMVSIADVGIGVSQALPVVVALHTANPGQLVYIEQPEIHLHPRAQDAMAEVLADAAKEGKRLVIETHSNLLLRGIQTAVAEGKLPSELVKLHWFTQQEDGSTRIDSADLDEMGAFGNWPEDFHTVTLQSEGRYIDAAEARLMGE